MIDFLALQSRRDFLPVLLLIFSFFPALISAQEQARDNPELYQSFVEKGDSLLTVGSLKEAEIAYKQAVLFSAEPVDAYKGLSKVAIQRSDWQAHRKWFNEIVRLDPDDIESLYELRNPVFDRKFDRADSLRNAGVYHSARRLYEELVEINPRSYEAVIGLARTYYQLQDWPNIKKWNLRAIELDPNDDEPYEMLTVSPDPRIHALVQEGDFLLANHDGQGANTRYQEALKLYDGAIYARKGLGRLAFYRSDWGEVKDQIKEFYEIESHDLDALYMLGVAYMETGKAKSLLMKKHDFNKSEELLGRLISLDSTYSDVLFQRGYLERLKDNWKPAIQYAERQLDLKPEQESSHIGLMKFYISFMAHTNKDEVEAFLLSKDSEWARYALGEFYRRKENHAASDSVFKHLLGDNVKNSMEATYVGLIKLKIQEDKLEEATRFFRASLDSMKTFLDGEILFESCKYIFKEQELSIFRSLGTPEHRRNFFVSFWTSRDPMPAANINYRAIEHFRRLIHAEKNYWYDDVRSWANNPDKTQELKFPTPYYLNQEFNDKGIIYIHHGEPDQIATTPDISNNNESWLYHKRANRQKYIFHFKVEDTATGNVWRLVPYLTDVRLLADRAGWSNDIDRLYLNRLKNRSDDEFNIIVDQIASDSRKDVTHALKHDYHTWETKVEPIDVHYRLATFRGSRNQARLEVYFGLPVEQLAHAGNGADPHLRYGAGIFDKFWKPISELKKSTRVDSLDPRQIHRGYFIDQFEVNLDPEAYNLSIFGRYADGTQMGSVNASTEVPAFNNDDLAMSDIKLAYDIRPVDEDAFFVRHDLSILPNPIGTFTVDDNVFIYYELYNMEKDSDGETRFDIENTLTLVKENKSGLSKIFGIFGGGGKKSISIKNSRTGNRSYAFEFASFNVSKMSPGDYELTVTVHDRVRDHELKKSLPLTLTKSE